MPRQSRKQQQEPANDFSMLRFAYHHLTEENGLDPKQAAVLAVMFFVGIVNRDEGPDAAKSVVLTALKEMGPPFVPEVARSRRTRTTE